MTPVADRESQRVRWCRSRARHGLDDVDGEGFGVGGLARRLRDQSVQLLLLPGDSEAVRLDFEDETWEWLAAEAVVTLDGFGMRIGELQVPTAHAAALVGPQGRERWDHYLAVHRSGEVEVGLGGRGGIKPLHEPRILSGSSISFPRLSGRG